MRRAAFALVLVAATVVAPARTQAQPKYTELVGSLHEHSEYSDGWPGTTPSTYFEAGRAEGLDFMGSGEHSDSAHVPVTFSDGCFGPAITSCVGTSAEYLDKWSATQAHAEAATANDFVAFRGFEWTSDRFNHINVYFSEHDANAKTEGGYATMESFWRWFTTSPAHGGGADGLATFNHPGREDDLEAVDPGFNWNDFAYVSEADHRMVALEVYNEDDSFGGYYVRALDKGWHLGAIGAEDLHGVPNKEDDYGSARWAKTVVLAEENTAESIREAMLARRFYAIRYNPTRRLTLDFSIDGAPMGSRLVRAPGDVLQITAKANHPDADVELVTSGGTVIERQGGEHWEIPWTPVHRYYFMRVKQNGEYTGYSSPVWISPQRQATTGEWLAGDLHVHTCYSHDAYCPPDDDNTGPDEFYTLSGDVEERFIEASARGLDYLAITDHNDVRSVDHPGFGSHGVLGIAGYEKSLRGHAQMLGAERIYDAKQQTVDHVNGAANELRKDGGVFQINHPAEDLLTPLDAECSDTDGLDWQYGFDVVPDTLEVWNIGHFWQPRLPSASSTEDAIRYWECWLTDGHRVGATGGSDSHWLSISAIQGPGNPTTWVFAADRTQDSVLQALREGRTSISAFPPVFGELRLHLEADADGNGTYESIVGDEVPPGSAMRVRADGLRGAGFVEVRANSETIVDNEALLPGGAVPFDAPSKSGWVRATLRGPDLRYERAATCDPLVGGETTYCRNHIAVLALTSPIYLAASPGPAG